MTSMIQLIILVVLGVLFGLSVLSRRYPHSGWLQTFHSKWPQVSDWLQTFRSKWLQVSEEQKARMQRRANIRAGIQFILLGFGMPSSTW